MVYSSLLPSQGLKSECSSALIAGIGCFAVKAVASHQKKSDPVVWSKMVPFKLTSCCVAVVPKLLMYRHE